MPESFRLILLMYGLVVAFYILGHVFVVFCMKVRH